LMPTGDPAIPVGHQAGARDVEYPVSLQCLKKTSKFDSQSRATCLCWNDRHYRWQGRGAKLNCHGSYFLMSGFGIKSSYALGVQRIRSPVVNL
jgi:hypothetical protein